MALQALTADIVAAANFGIYHLQSESSCSLPNLNHLRGCNCVTNYSDGRPEAVLDLSAWRRAAPFFAAISLSMALSSIATAKSFFSLVFSFSSA
jgi:hypothetical protein